jgi:hypothetical protein
VKRWIALTAVMLIAVSCGGGDGEGSDAAGSEANERQEALLEFAECMREHGVDMPDPEIDDDGLVRIGPNPGSEVDPETMQEADEACRDLMPKMEEPSEEERIEMQDALVEFTQCMREHGVDMPDPSGDGRIIFRGNQQSDVDPAVDFDDPEFQKAQEECSVHLPNRAEGAE